MQFCKRAPVRSGMQFNATKYGLLVLRIHSLDVSCGMFRARRAAIGG
jgi:hypothetical protein